MLPNQLTHRMLITYNPMIGHLYVPNTFLRIPVEPESYFIKTNNEGFRSDFNFTSNKTCDKRIIFLGDSHTAGDGVPNEKRFSDLITNSISGLESYNFGLSGSGIDQQILIYENIVKKFEHDIICFSLHLEDINRLDSTRNYIDRNTNEIYKVPKPYFTLDSNKLQLHNVPVPLNREKSTEIYTAPFNGNKTIMQLFRKYTPRLFKEIAMKKYYNFYNEYEKDHSEKWELTKALIYRLVEKSEGKPIILCPLPHPKFCNILKYQAKFIAIEKKFKNVFFIDLPKYFNKFSRAERWSLHSDKTSHYNEFGHKIIAEAIENCLISNNLIPKKSSK